MPVLYITVVLQFVCMETKNMLHLRFIVYMKVNISILTISSICRVHANLMYGNYVIVKMFTSSMQYDSYNMTGTKLLSFSK